MGDAQTDGVRENSPLPELDAAQRGFADGLKQALTLDTGGEIIVRAGTQAGRVFVCNTGRIAWVTATSLKKTLSDHLISDYGIAPNELRAVYEECKTKGCNFAETIVAWNVMDREALREALLAQLARGVLEILSWPDATTMVVPANRAYHSSLTFTPAELFVAAEQESTPPLRPVVWRLAALFTDEGTGPAPEPTSEASPSEEAPSPQPHDARRVITRESQMALENYLAELKDIKGYKAAGIMHYTGEMLAADWTGPEVDINLVGATFNDIFRSSHEACQKIGLDACTEEVINTPKGQVIMRCSGVHSAAHFHMLCILTADGNQALAKMRMEKLVPKITEELR